ncbi:hypothetical protein D3C71_809620 [compost metagenome]
MVQGKTGADRGVAEGTAEQVQRDLGPDVVGQAADRDGTVAVVAQRVAPPGPIVRAVGIHASNPCREAIGAHRVDHHLALRVVPEVRAPHRRPAHRRGHLAGRGRDEERRQVGAVVAAPCRCVGQALVCRQAGLRVGASQLQPAVDAGDCIALRRDQALRIRDARRQCGQGRVAGLARQAVRRVVDGGRQRRDRIGVRRVRGDAGTLLRRHGRSGICLVRVDDRFERLPCRHLGRIRRDARLALLVDQAAGERRARRLFPDFEGIAHEVVDQRRTDHRVQAARGVGNARERHGQALPLDRLCAVRLRPCHRLGLQRCGAGRGVAGDGRLQCGDRIGIGRVGGGAHALLGHQRGIGAGLVARDRGRQRRAGRDLRVVGGDACLALAVDQARADSTHVRAGVGTAHLRGQRFARRDFRRVRRGPRALFGVDRGIDGGQVPGHGRGQCLAGRDLGGIGIGARRLLRHERGIRARLVAGHGGCQLLPGRDLGAVRAHPCIALRCQEARAQCADVVAVVGAAQLRREVLARRDLGGIRTRTRSDLGLQRGVRGAR